MPDIPLELYRTFYEVGRTGNITRAAENLFVTQPNVSIALKSLEQRLGARLCTRSKKGIALTEEGQVLFAELDTAFSHIAAGEKKLQSLLALESGSVSLSSSGALLNFLLPCLSGFMADYPGIRLEIIDTSSRETADRVLGGSVDIGFVNLPMEEPSLSATPICPITDILVAGSKYAYLTGNPFPLERLCDFPIIIHHRTSVTRGHIDHFLAQHGIELHYFMESAGMNFFLSFVRSGLGLAFVTKEFCTDSIDGKNLFVIDLTPPLPPRSLGLVHCTLLPLSHAATCFRDYVFAYYNAV